MYTSILDERPSLLGWGKIPLDLFYLKNPNYFEDKLITHPTIDKERKLPTHWIESTIAQLTDCIETTTNVFAVQLDLHYPETIPQFSIKDTNDDFYLFTAHIELILKERSYTRLIGWMGCREYDIVTGKKYFHAVLFLDGDRIEGVSDKDHKGMTIINRINQAWYAFTHGYTTYATVRAVRKEDTKKVSLLLRNIFARLLAWNIKVKDEHDIVLFPEKYHKSFI